MVLLKQLRGTQSLLKVTTNGTVLEGIYCGSSCSGVAGRRRIIRYSSFLLGSTCGFLLGLSCWLSGAVAEELDGMLRLVETWNKERRELFVADNFPCNDAFLQ